jgi:putative cell wall-binding protein
LRARSSRLVAAIALVLIGLLAAPAGAQEPLPTLPGVDVLPDLPEAPDETGPIGEVLDGLLDRITDGLADVPYPNVLRLLGEDAVAASVALSEATFDTSEVALIARADLFADSLSSGATQGATGAPLLLTHSVLLDSRVRQELERLGTKSVVILGLGQAIHPILEERLQTLGYETTRIGGATRVETALELAKRLQPQATKAILARGYGADGSQTFADALTVGPRAAENEWPLLLTPSDNLRESVATYLTSSSIREVEIVGGTDAVSSRVESQLQALGITTTRVAGANRNATAVEVAKARGIPTPEDLSRVILVEGTGEKPVWAPGFASAAHGAVNGAPVLLSAGSTLPNETVEYLVSGLPKVNLAIVPLEELLEASPVLLCATFVDPAACLAASLLLMGQLPEAADLLDLDLSRLPLLSELLDLVDETAEPLEPILEPITDPLEPILDPLDPVLDTELLDSDADLLS